MKSGEKKWNLVIMMSTYNGHDFLDIQLKSIYEQDYDGDVLLFVRDDGSNDDTLDILRRWADRMPVIIMENVDNLGPALSFWELLKNAPEAEFYAFADQDDIWDKGKLSSAIQVLEGDSGKELWFSNCRLIDKDGVVFAEKMNENSPNVDIITQLMCGITQGCSMVFTKWLVQFCLSKKVDFIPMHDTVVLCFALVEGKAFYDHEPRFSYRIHENNVYAKEGKDFFRKIKSRYKIWIKNRGYVTKLAKEVYENGVASLSDDRIKYISILGKEKKSIKDKIFLISSPLCFSTNRKIKRSYVLRVILGLI